MNKTIKKVEDLIPGDIIFGLGVCVSVLLIDEEKFLGKHKLSKVLIGYMSAEKEKFIQVSPSQMMCEKGTIVAVENVS